MTIDMDTVRERALSQGRLIDMNALRERIFVRRDFVSACWILLTALIKGEDAVRKRILNAVRKEHLGHSLIMGDDIFEWVTQSLKSKGAVDVAALYQNMEEYIHRHVLSEQKTFLEQVLAVEVPDPEEIGRVLVRLKQNPSSYADLASERLVLAALIKGNAEIRKRLLDQLDPDEDIRHSAHGKIFTWITQLLQTKGQADEKEIYEAMERYVFDDLAPVYIGHIDHVLAIETPDADTVDMAIRNIQRRIALQEVSLREKQ